MDATGKRRWRPEGLGVGNRTPLENDSGVQKEKGEETGRRVDANAASRRVESCEMDAMGMSERRPKSQILINRTPGGRECGVQKGKKLWNGRHWEA